MAPELFDGTPASVSTDLYALGVLLFYLVTGGYPVLAGTLAELRSAHRRSTRTLLRDARPDVPTGLAQVVDRALSLSTAERFRTAADMARFIVADLTDPSSVPKELEAIVPSLAVPVQPLLEGAARPYAMFKDYWKYDWVLPPHWYQGLDQLLASLVDKVVAPAEAKLTALNERRRAIEAELTTPQQTDTSGDPSA